MKRDIIQVLGKTGFGKSLWCKLFTRSNKRLLVFDPVASFDDVEWLNFETMYSQFDDDSPGEILQKEFRFGAFEFEALETFGDMAFVTGDNLLVLEEASQIFKKGCALPDWTNRLTFMGRHEACSMLITAQRASSVPIDLRSQSNRVISFRQSELTDMKWLSEFFNKDEIKQITQLPPGVCLDFQDNVVTRVDIRPAIKAAFNITID